MFYFLAICLDLEIAIWMEARMMGKAIVFSLLALYP